MYGDRQGVVSSTPSGAAWLEWRSVAVGAVAALAIVSVTMIRPAGQQCARLERQLAALADVVARLEVAEGDVAVTGRLLATLEDQSRQCAAAEAALLRLTSVQDRLASQAERLQRATDAVARVEAFSRGLEAIDCGELDTAQATAARMAQLGATLSAQATDIDAAQDQLGRLLDLKSDLLRHASDLDAAETTLGHLQELADWLASSAAVVGDLRHFVVDVVLLQPSVERAREALEPVISLTRAGRSRTAVASPTKPTVQSAAQSADPSVSQPADPSVVNPVTDLSVGEAAAGESAVTVIKSAVQPATAASR